MQVIIHNRLPHYIKVSTNQSLTDEAIQITISKQEGTHVKPRETKRLDVKEQYSPYAVI